MTAILVSHSDANGISDVEHPAPDGVRGRAGDVSQLLMRWQAGDTQALEELTPVVYAELRRLGRSHLNRTRQPTLLQPTALVHEAWIRLEGKRDLDLSTRNQFFALAGRIMRDLLVDHCRRHRAAKRGGSNIRITLSGIDPSDGTTPSDFLVLNDAIQRLGDIKQRYTQIVEMRFFAGLSIDETARELSVSHATIEREWNFARSWLRRELGSARGSVTEQGNGRT